MAKYNWSIKETVLDDESNEKEVLHSISLSCSFLTGRAIITIDGDEYNISAKPFKLRGTSQMFRLGEMPAVIDFPKSGKPAVKIGNETYEAK